MTKKWLIPGFLALFLPSAVALSLHGYLGSFSRFMGDDFCAAFIAERFGVLRAVWYWYLNWNGGYSVSILGELLPLIKPGGMGYVIPIVLALWFAITVIAISMFLPQGAQIREKIWASLSLGGAALFVILLLSPDVPQSFYWWAGMRPYTMPLIIITLYAILYQWYGRKQREKNEVLLWVGISFLVTAFGGGLSETFTPVQIVFFALLTGWNIIINKARVRDQNFLIPTCWTDRFDHSADHHGQCAWQRHSTLLPASRARSHHSFTDCTLRILCVPAGYFQHKGKNRWFDWAGAGRDLDWHAIQTLGKTKVVVSAGFFIRGLYFRIWLFSAGGIWII